MANMKRERPEIEGGHEREPKARKLEQDYKLAQNGHASPSHCTFTIPQDFRCRVTTTLETLFSHSQVSRVLEPEGISDLKQLREHLVAPTTESSATTSALEINGYDYQAPLNPPPPRSQAGENQDVLPTLPEIRSGIYTSAPFVHTSVQRVDRITGQALAQSGLPLDLHGHNQVPNYERLEFLGDAYIELLASTLIFSRFPHLTPGRQSQLRETLVNNTTLMRFSRAYAFDQKLIHHGLNLAQFASGPAKSSKGNKGLNKVLADCFEAYVAALILSDPETGYATAQTWLWGLWTPLLTQETGEGDLTQLREWRRQWEAWAGDVGAAAAAAPSSSSTITHSDGKNRRGPSAAPTITSKHGADDDDDAAVLAAMRANQARSTNPYNPGAKAELQKRICPAHVRLVYRDHRAPVRLKQTQIFYQEVALTGWGYENRVLGRGEGESKAEAGNRAATDAMRTNARLVGECEAKWAEAKERRRKEKEGTTAPGTMRLGSKFAPT